MTHPTIDDRPATGQCRFSVTLCAGTTILTADGEWPVEAVTPGARLVTRDVGVSVLRARRVRSAAVSPIRVAVGALGDTRPDRATLVLPDTVLHLRDWRARVLFGADNVLLEAARLVDGERLRAEGRRTMEVVDLVFDCHHVLYADGLEVASTPSTPPLP